jgi:hypothetical protein
MIALYLTLILLGLELIVLTIYLLPAPRFLVQMVMNLLYHLRLTIRIILGFLAYFVFGMFE